MDFTEDDRANLEDLLAQAQETVQHQSRVAQDAQAVLLVAKDWRDTIRGILADLDAVAEG